MKHVDPKLDDMPESLRTTSKSRNLVAMAKAAQAEYESLQHKMRRYSAEPPRPGDLYIFEQTSAQGVVWVVIEHERDAGRERFMVLAADPMVLVGNGDVAIPEESQAGALSVRVGFGAWLEAADFTTARRYARLEQEYVEQIRRHRAAAVTDGTVDPPPLAEEPLETREWQEALREALRAIDVPPSA